MKKTGEVDQPVLMEWKPLARNDLMRARAPRSDSATWSQEKRPTNAESTASPCISNNGSHPRRKTSGPGAGFAKMNNVRAGMPTLINQLSNGWLQCEQRKRFASAG